jgi:hypothetical protein
VTNLGPREPLSLHQPVSPDGVLYGSEIEALQPAAAIIVKQAAEGNALVSLKCLADADLLEWRIISDRATVSAGSVEDSFHGRKKIRKHANSHRRSCSGNNIDEI